MKPAPYGAHYSAVKSSLKKHVRRVIVNTEILPPLKKRRWLECLYYIEAHEGDMAGAAENAGFAWMCNRLLRLYSEDELEADWKGLQNVAANQQLWGHCTGGLFRRTSQLLPNVEHVEFIDKRGIHMRDPGPIDEPLGLCSPWKNMLLDPILHLIFG